MPAKHRRRPLRLTPVPRPVLPLPQTQERLACACVPASSQRRAAHQSCAACRAWDLGTVLLADGTTITKAVWVAAHAVAEETYA